MSLYKKVGDIALWSNQNKTGQQPDITGSITLTSGKKLSLSLWKRKEGAHENAPAYSGEVQSKDDAPAQPPQSTQTEFEDEIPF